MGNGLFSGRSHPGRWEYLRSILDNHAGILRKSFAQAYDEGIDRRDYQLQCGHSTKRDIQW